MTTRKDEEQDESAGYPGRDPMLALLNALVEEAHDLNYNLTELSRAIRFGFDNIEARLRSRK